MLTKTRERERDRHRHISDRQAMVEKAGRQTYKSIDSLTDRQTFLVLLSIHLLVHFQTDYSSNPISHVVPVTAHKQTKDKQISLQ